MTFDDRSLRQPTGLIITFCGARIRTVRFGRWTTLFVAGALPMLGICYLGATLYFVFHDQLLASLMARQTDMQYAYEDKIAALRTQLDRETSRGLIDRRTLDTTLHDLATRGDRLAARAATIDALVTQGRLTFPASAAKDSDISPPPPTLDAGQRGALSAYDAPSSASSPDDLRLDRSADTPTEGSDRRSELSSGSKSAELAARYDRLEMQQAAAVTQLRGPHMREVERLRSALAETGLPTSRWQTDKETDVGGPFVPLPPRAGSAGFDGEVDLLRDAVQQEARLRLVVNHVPLRRPLEGALAVTSTFGPRLDPFLGRPAMHTGIDLHEDSGDAVESTAAGVVTVAGTEGGYGNMVEIDHGNGLATRYAHLSAIEVVPHQKVPAGFVVGRVGSTGRATGPHLHYEVRINGEPIDPARFLKASTILFPG